MDEMRQLPSVRPDSWSERRSTKPATILDSRVTLSDALAIAGKIIASYPGRKVEDSYIGAIADALMSYPAAVVHRAHKVPGGIPACVDHMPNVTDVIAWCESETAPLRRQVAYEQRIKQQLAEREIKPQTERGMEITREWLERHERGRQSRRTFTSEQKEAFMVRAAEIGEEMKTMKLRPETQQVLANREK